MHKSELFFYSLIAFMAGVFLSSFFSVSLVHAYILLIFGLAIIVINGLKNNKYFFVGLIVIFFSLGFYRFTALNAEYQNISDFTGRELVILGYVKSEPELDGTIQRFKFHTEDFGNIMITTSAFPGYEFGDNLQVEGVLEKPKNFSDFDYVSYLRKEGVKYTIGFPEIGYDEKEIRMGLIEKINLLIYKNIFQIKNRFETVINTSITEPNASFVNGILLGTRQNIPDDLLDDFSETGTTHILAISGYNIMIISEMVLLGLIWFFKRRTAFWISVFIIFMFVVITGSSASVVRAAVMGLLLSFARGYGRLYDPRNSIILAGSLMVWFNPFVLAFDAGFQLSFLAVIGLIYLYPWIDSKLYKLPKLGNFKEIVLMTISAQIAVAPLLIYYFRNFSPVSLPTNILILPFIPIAMLTGFLTGLAGMINPLAGQIIGYIAWAITTYQIEVVRFMGNLVQSIF